MQLPGCRQACGYWDDAKSAGLPTHGAIDVKVFAVNEVVLFQWQPPTKDLSAHVVYVLRTYSAQRSEWIVLLQVR